METLGSIPSSQKRWDAFPAALTGLFLVAVLVQMHHHIMWRDELRTWQIARECTGLGSLISAFRFDAVPILWNAIVFLLTQIFNNPAAMQVVHALIAAGVVYVVARWAPFSRLKKILFALGYFPLYEYGVISRSYSLIFLFTMIACALISQPRLRLLALAGVLFLLSQVSLWGAGFAGLLFIAGAIKAFWTERDPKPNPGQAIAAAVIVLAGVGLCITQLFPGPGPSFLDSWIDAGPADRFIFTIASIYRALVPIPALIEHFWNSNILDSADPKCQVQAVLGFILFAFIVLVLVRRPLALGMLVAGAGGLLLFMALRFRGQTRHYGHLYMLIIAAFWIAQTSPAWEKPSRITERIRPACLTVLLALNAIAGIIAAAQAFRYPFSATWATAQHIKSTYGDSVIVAALTDYCAAPIAQWLDRPLYSIQMGQFTRYNTQDDAARHPTEVRRMFSDLYDLSEQRKKNVVLLLNSNLATQIPIPLAQGAVPLSQIPPGNELVIGLSHSRDGQMHQMHIRVEAIFGESVVKDESQWFYLIFFDN